MYVPSYTKSPLHSVGFFQFFKLQPIWIWEKIENISRTKSKSLDLFRSFKESISELRPLSIFTKINLSEKRKILLEFLPQQKCKKNRKKNCSNKSITLCSFVAGWTFKVQVQQHATTLVTLVAQQYVYNKYLCSLSPFMVSYPLPKSPLHHNAQRCDLPVSFPVDLLLP